MSINKKIISDKNTSSIMVSVSMITYNHENYIKEAILGVLNQSTQFDYELIISDDCSNDNTKMIIEKIINFHPKGEYIKFFNPEKNLGITKNFLFTLNKAQGKYIAICEGDDYWIDENKLQRQVDFLEENPEYSGCATQTMIINEGNTTAKPQPFRIINQKRLTHQDFLQERPFHTASLLFRNNLPLQKFPLGILSADRFLYLLISSFGDIHFDLTATCVYRKNDGGISKRVTSKQLRTDLRMVKVLYSINPNIDKNSLYKFIHKTIINYSTRLYIKDFLISYGMLCYYNFKAFKKINPELKLMLANFLPKLISVSHRKKILV